MSDKFVDTPDGLEWDEPAEPAEPKRRNDVVDEIRRLFPDASVPEGRSDAFYNGLLEQLKKSR